MSTTYKPALLKAVTRILARERQTVIALTAIGAEFARLYWNQTVVFHLRQAAVLGKEPEVLQSIRVASQRYRARALRDLPDEAYGTIVRDLARILKINVLRAFHTSKPAGALPLFTWREGAEEIVLPEAAVDFIVTNSQALEVITNYWWAGYLEKVNMLAPSIIDKVGRDGARRSSLVKYFRILTAAGDDHCFYCGRTFSDKFRAAVDHVLPWSFLLADPAWDLVLACMPCNSAKSDWLPERTFIDKLVALNARRELPPAVSAFVPPISELEQLFDAAISVEWPGFWAPGMAPLAITKK